MKVRKFIDVKDEKPEEKRKILVMNIRWGTQISKAEYWKIFDVFILDGSPFIPIDVTHWCYHDEDSE